MTTLEIAVVHHCVGVDADQVSPVPEPVDLMLGPVAKAGIEGEAVLDLTSSTMTD